jgi:predicted DNA-binding transcriptional regulator AlpA
VTEKKPPTRPRLLPGSPQLRTRDLLKKLGICAKTFWHWRRRYDLPRPRKIDGKALAWDYNAVVLALRRERAL